MAAALLLSKCALFREKEEFIDVRLKVGEDVFPAHRNVLAANSDYFYAMFTDGLRESKEEVIELKDESISPDALKIVLDSIYSGNILVNKENVFEVLITANHLQVASVVKQCCDCLDQELVQRQLDVQTYRQVSAFADIHGLKDLQEATQRKMASMYHEVCESDEFLSHIDADQLWSLLSRDDLSAPSETFIFKSVMQWIKYKEEERMPVAAKVIGAVRLGLVDIKDVIRELNTEEMQRVPEIQALVRDSLLHSNMPSHDSKFAVEKTKPRSMCPVRIDNNRENRPFHGFMQLIHLIRWSYRWYTRIFYELRSIFPSPAGARKKRFIIISLRAKRFIIPLHYFLAIFVLF